MQKQHLIKQFKTEKYEKNNEESHPNIVDAFLRPEVLLSERVRVWSNIQKALEESVLNSELNIRKILEENATNEYSSIRIFKRLQQGIAEVLKIVQIP